MTHLELAFSFAKRSERYLLSVREQLLNSIPNLVHRVHVDNALERVNHAAIAILK
jgi:hypothetical protein